MRRGQEIVSRVRADCCASNMEAGALISYGFLPSCPFTLSAAATPP